MNTLQIEFDDTPIEQQVYQWYCKLESYKLKSVLITLYETLSLNRNTYDDIPHSNMKRLLEILESQKQFYINMGKTEAKYQNEIETQLLLEKHQTECRILLHEKEEIMKNLKERVQFEIQEERHKMDKQENINKVKTEQLEKDYQRRLIDIQQDVQQQITLEYQQNQITNNNNEIQIRKVILDQNQKLETLESNLYHILQPVTKHYSDLSSVNIVTKGKASEDDWAERISSQTKREVQIVRGTGHTGDLIVKAAHPHEFDVMIEVKNYNQKVPKREITKFEQDVENTGFPSIMLSKSSLVNRESCEVRLNLKPPRAYLAENYATVENVAMFREILMQANRIHNNVESGEIKITQDKLLDFSKEVNTITREMREIATDLRRKATKIDNDLIKRIDRFRTFLLG